MSASSSTPPKFNNDGSFRKSGGTGATNVSMIFNNAGVVKIETGSIRFTVFGEHTGTFDLSAGTTLEFAGGGAYFRAGSSVIGQGRLSIGAGTINAVGTAVNAAGPVTLSGGSLLITGDQTFFGGLDWSNGTLGGTGVTTIASGATFNLTGTSSKYLDGRILANAGVCNWTSTGSNFQGSNGAVIENLAGATFDAKSNATLNFHSVGGESVFNNAGLFKKSAGTGITEINWTFNNTGTVQVNTGTLRFSTYNQNQDDARILLNGGTFSTKNSAPLIIQAGSIDGAGTVLASSVTMNGRISPGFSAGKLIFNANLTLQNTSQLLFELGGKTQGTSYDYIDVNAAFTAGGLLNVSFLNGFQSNVLATDTFTLLTANSSITGVFSNAASGARLTTADGFGSFLAQYGNGPGAANLVLSNFLPTLPGDFDFDADVDGADFVIWQTNFPKASGATFGTGDADGDGDVDGADFVVWQTNFPRSPAPGISPVSEPTSCILALAGFAIGIFASRRSRPCPC
jgi:hypothetical protein